MVTTRASEAQKYGAESCYGVVVLAVYVMAMALYLSQAAWAEEKQAATAGGGLASSVPSSSALPKADEMPHHDDDEHAVSFQDLDDQKRILEAARKALAMHSRTVHQSLSLSSKDIDNKQLLNRDATLRLVGIYENMRPRDAAAVFNVMDPHVLVAIAAAMNTRKLSAIMAQMSRDRVNMVSQYLVGVRRFHQRGSNGAEGSLPGGLIISVPQNTPYNAQGKPSAGGTPFLPSRQ